MTEETFEQQFPGLEGFAGTKKQIEEKDERFETALWTLASGHKEGIIGTFPDYEAQTYVNTHHIQKHCFYKKRVIDTLEHWLQSNQGLLKAIKKELGLDENDR